MKRGPEAQQLLPYVNGILLWLYKVVFLKLQYNSFIIIHMLKNYELRSQYFDLECFLMKTKKKLWVVLVNIMIFFFIKWTYFRDIFPIIIIFTDYHRWQRDHRLERAMAAREHWCGEPGTNSLQLLHRTEYQVWEGRSHEGWNDPSLQDGKRTWLHLKTTQGRLVSLCFVKIIQEIRQLQ